MTTGRRMQRGGTTALRTKIVGRFAVSKFPRWPPQFTVTPHWLPWAEAAEYVIDYIHSHFEALQDLHSCLLTL